jgi:hypothetical protein
MLLASGDPEGRTREAAGLAGGVPLPADTGVQILRTGTDLGLPT